MFKSLYFKIVLILLVFIVAVMSVVSIVLLNSVTSFYVNQFMEQMDECFAENSTLYVELQEALDGASYADKQKTILKSYESVLGIDAYRNYYILTMDGVMVDGSDAELGRDLRITPNMLSAMSGKTENKLLRGDGYTDFALYLQNIII